MIQLCLESLPTVNSCNILIYLAFLTINFLDRVNISELREQSVNKYNLTDAGKSALKSNSGDFRALPVHTANLAVSGPRRGLEDLLAIREFQVHA